MFKANGKGKCRAPGAECRDGCRAGSPQLTQDRKMANRGFEYEESRLEGRAFLVARRVECPRL